MSDYSPRSPFRGFLPGLFTVAMLMAAGAGQAGVPDRDAEILIHSQPEGATVMVLGKTWGVTPMRLQVKDAFPALYRPEQPYIGMAVYLRKDGCSEFRQPIHRRNVPTEIKAELDCEPGINTEAAAPVAIAPAGNGTSPTGVPAGVPAGVPVSPPAPKVVAPPAKPSISVTSSVRRKLEELEELHKAGLVTEQEYQQLRKRILAYF